MKFSAEGRSQLATTLETLRDEQSSAKYSLNFLRPTEGGVPAALSYMCLNDISKKRIVLNMHYMHSMHIFGGGACCAVVYVYERYNWKTYSLEYAFDAFYAKYGGGCAVLYITLRDINKRCKGITPLLRRDCLLFGHYHIAFYILVWYGDTHVFI